jgi:hypothetical protein
MDSGLKDVAGIAGKSAAEVAAALVPVEIG